jgi:hypothetical protein
MAGINQSIRLLDMDLKTMLRIPTRVEIISFCHHFQNGLEFHPTSYPVATASEVPAARTFNTHLHLIKKFAVTWRQCFFSSCTHSRCAVCHINYYRLPFL